MAKKTHTEKKTRTIAERETYHTEQLKKIQIRKQIEELRKKLK